MERDFGDLTGRTWEDVIAQHGAQIEEQSKGLHYDYRSFGGESHEQVRERLRRLLDELARYHARETVAAVTHGGIIKLLHEELHIALPEHIPNASVHRFAV